ncbi:MAG: MurR/RpiR family transcriptional regulator, partial [Oscillospiraceae bacterium]|nr:MurR/RpiR family transcriptional regulator [Oscillospiraceae bacterium]
MQQALQEMVLSRLTGVQRMEVTTERIAQEDILSTVLRGDMERLRDSSESISREAFNNAVEALLAAKRIYVMGVRSSSALASFLSYYLNYMFEDVRLITTSSDSEAFEQLVRISSEDAIVGISFPRYSSATIQAMKYARAAGATTVALTDSESSPLADHADCLLAAKSDMVSIVDSLVAPMSIINALLLAVCSRRKEQTANTFDKLEEIWEMYHVYEKIGE